MKKIIIVILALISHNIMAQNIEAVKNNQITISGVLSDTVIQMVSKSPYLTFYNDYNLEDPSTREIIPLQIKDRKFKIKISPKGRFGYFDIGGGMIRSITNNEFLIESGDSVNMDVKNLEDVEFTGEGAEKLTFQNWIGKFIWANPKLWTRDDKIQDILRFNKQRSIRFMAIAMDVLNRNETIKNSYVKNILRLNTASSISKQYLNSIVAPTYFNDSTYFKEVKEEINFLITQQNGFLISDVNLIANSFMYSQYLFELNEAIAMIKTKSDKASVNIVYNNIKSEYDGLLRDKLLPYCFLTMLKEDPEAINFLPEALILVKDSASKKILHQVEIAKLPGVKSFEFDLMTLNGKHLKSKDLEGKIVIIETYYNGCMPCRELAMNMEPIAKYYEKNNKVVFINLDGVAKDYKTFEKGAKSGNYGSKQSIYTWTNGLGQRHPLLLYYQYDSFPNLLIIGKDGNVISANPQKPLDGKSRLNFIALINKNL